MFKILTKTIDGTEYVVGSAYVGSNSGVRITAGGKKEFYRTSPLVGELYDSSTGRYLFALDGSGNIVLAPILAKDELKRVQKELEQLEGELRSFLHATDWIVVRHLDWIASGKKFGREIDPTVLIDRDLARERINEIQLDIHDV